MHIQTASPFDRETWFDFDRLNFEADSATLRPDSREQLASTAAILKASTPNVRVKIGGYTGRWGNPATNLRLSQLRASAVAAELKSLGVAANRLLTEGYGDQHPLASNIRAQGAVRGGRVAIESSASSRQWPARGRGSSSITSLTVKPPALVGPGSPRRSGTRNVDAQSASPCINLCNTEGLNSRLNRGIHGPCGQASIRSFADSSKPFGRWWRASIRRPLESGR